MLTDKQVAQSQDLIRAAIRQRILKPIDPTKRLIDQPAIVLGCCDYTQVERYEHCRHRVAAQAQEIKLHGGALLLDPDSPANHDYNWLEVVERQTAIAVEAKGSIEYFIAFVDWFCGVAVKHHLDAEQIFRSAIRGKLRAKQPGQFLNGWQVRLLFYLHDYSFLEDFAFVREHPEADGFTFYFGAREMEQFLDHRIQARSHPSLVT